MSYYTRRQNGYAGQSTSPAASQPPPAPSSRYFDYAKWQSQQQAAKQQPKPQAVVRPQQQSYAPTSYAASNGTYSYAAPAASSASSYAAPTKPAVYNPYSSSAVAYGSSSAASSSVSYYGGGNVSYGAPPAAASKPPAAAVTSSSTVSYYSAPAKPSPVAAASNGYPAPYGASYNTASSTKVGITATTNGAVAKPQPAAVVTTTTTTAVVKPSPADPYAAYGSGSVACAITKAVFVGINYTGQRGLELKGCVNDVINSVNLFKDMGAKLVEEQNCRTLLDNGKARRRPTKAEMLSAMEWLTADCKEGDVLWFHYSGHGSQERDRTGEEDDGMNESIIPVDYTTNGSIIDNDLYNRLVKPLKKGVTLFAILDCCHSGTILDLRYIFDEMTGKLIVDDDYRERREDEGTVFMLSGCMSTQTSADLPPDTRQGLKAQSVGAMTSSYLPLLGQGLSWPNFIKQLRTGLKKSRLTQVPQFEISRNINLSEVAFRPAFPSLGGASGKGAGAEERYIPHEDVVKHCSKHAHKLKKKAEAKAAEAGSGEEGYYDGLDGECTEEEAERGIRRGGAAAGRNVGRPYGANGVSYPTTTAVVSSPPRRQQPVYATAAGNPYAASSLASVARYPGAPQPQAVVTGQRSLPGVGPQAGGIPAVRGQRRF